MATVAAVIASPGWPTGASPTRHLHLILFSLDV
jgi:hypothetical protein